MTNTKHLVFVYGTLLSGGSNPITEFLDSPVAFIGQDLIHGELYDLGWYPGFRPTEDDTSVVYGEIYEVTPEGLAVLDNYEGVPTLYRRVEVETLWYGFPVQVYEYNLSPGESLPEEHRIASGDWVSRFDQKQTQKIMEG